MQLSDQELRALVREAIARASGRSECAPPPPDPQTAFRMHASHVRLAVFSGGDEDGPCLIEPTVRCNHCGYCQSYGH